MTRRFIGDVRIVLTPIWLLSFIASLAILESYIGRLTHFQGGEVQILTADDRQAVLSPLFVIYGGHISAILAFWYLKPYRPLGNDAAGRFRMLLAVFCTIAFNGWILYMLLQGHFGAADRVLRDVQTAVETAGWMSILVAPINTYYFGAKMPA